MQSVSAPARGCPALDGLCGIAALAVLVYYAQQILHVTLTLPESGMAVDFFFMLSGLIVAYAYGAKLLGSMAFGSFAEVRVTRSWPLYILGCAIDLVQVEHALASTSTAWKMKWAGLSALFAVGFVPFHSRLVDWSVFLLNPPG